MSILGIDPNNIPEAVYLEPGDHELLCDHAEYKVSEKSGRSMIELRLKSIDNPEAETIFHYLVGAREGDSVKTIRLFAERLQEACDAFGVDLNSVTSEEELAQAFIGKTGWASVGVEEDPEFGRRNIIKRFIASQ